MRTREEILTDAAKDPRAALLEVLLDNRALLIGIRAALMVTPAPATAGEALAPPAAKVPTGPLSVRGRVCDVEGDGPCCNRAGEIDESDPDDPSIEGFDCGCVCHEDPDPLEEGRVRPVITGDQPVSILQELCQARGWDLPRYAIERMKNDKGDHAPRFRGTVIVRPSAGGEHTAKVENHKTKADAKKAAARAMLIEYLEAVEA